MTKISSNSIFNFTNFCNIVTFFTKLLTLGIIILSTAVRTVFIAKLIILDISALTSFILALREALVAKLIISGIWFSIFLILAL